MSSAATPPLSRKSSPSLLRDLRVLYRRVCVLRVSGKNDEADILAAGNLTSLRSRAKEELEVTEVELDALFASEEERVDNAHALAEILLPMLTANAIPAFGYANGAASRAVEPSRRIDGATTPTSPAAAPPTESTNTGPMLPGIADFIDEMLTQERTSAPAVNLRRPA